MSESVTFTSGGELSQAVKVTVVGDEAAEDGESLTLDFGARADRVGAGARVALVDGASEG